MNTSPRLRGQRRTDYAAYAGRRRQPASSLSCAVGAELKAAAHAEPVSPGNEIPRTTGEGERTGTAVQGPTTSRIGALLKKQALSDELLLSKLSDRLRELARRAAASRDEHLRQAQLLQTRAEREQKRKLVRSHGDVRPLKRDAAGSSVLHTTAPRGTGEQASPPRSTFRDAGSMDWKSSAEEPARLTLDEQVLQHLTKGHESGGTSTSAALEKRCQASIEALDTTVLGFSDADAASQRLVEDRILREATEIQQRNLELAKARLPKQPEPPRSKTHHDYLCEAMIWLATDYRERFKWHAAFRARLARAIHRFHEERKQRDARDSQAREVARIRRARLLSRHVQKFWESLFHMMIWEQQAQDERLAKRKRQRALDSLIHQTEDYVKVLAEELATCDSEQMVVDGEPYSTAELATGRESDRASQTQLPEITADTAANGTIRESDTQSLMPRATNEVHLSTSRARRPLPGCLMSSADASVDDVGTGGYGTQRQIGSMPGTADSVYSSAQRLGDASPEDRGDGDGGTALLPTKPEVAANMSERLPNTSLGAAAAPDVEEHSGNATQTSCAALSTKEALERPASFRSVDDALRILFRGRLRPYQHAGLQWLIALNEKGLNGMLADDMGLGKTIQTIALLAWLATAKQDWGPHLIVVPTSVVMNWNIEFKKFAPGLKVLCYFGTPTERAAKRRGWTKPNAFHVCVTSYHMVVQDATVFRRQQWSYLVLDEAQHIKNFQSQKWQTLLTFHSRHRLLLTGTPLQNSLIELWSLLHFLMPNVFQSHSEFREWFQEPIETLIQADASVQESMVERLHRVIRPFVLRRLKRDVERELPPKTEEIVWCSLSKRQRELYDDFMSRAATREKLLSGNYLSVMNVLIQLRKVCNHPDLFAGRPIDEPYASQRPLTIFIPHIIRAEAASETAQRRAPRLVDESMSREDAARIRALTAAARMLAETSACPTTCSDSQAISRASFASLLARIDRAEQTERNQLRLVSCSRRIAEPVIGASIRQLVRVPLRSAPALHPVATLERLVDRALAQALPFTLVVHRAIAPVPQLVSKAAFRYQRRTACGTTSPPLAYLFGLWRPLAIRQQLRFPDARLLQWDCGKLQRLAGLLRELEQKGHRVLIFTQMVRMLDILEQFLCLHRFAYIRMDGSTPTGLRLRLCERFNNDRRYLVFLSTTRSGGVGLNLTGADTVLFYDSDWNPTVDAQAQDRCHRIGQDRPVRIYRLVTEGTVEAPILRRALQKQRLEQLVLADGLFTTEVLQRVHPLELIEGGPAPPPVHPNPYGGLEACGLTEQEYIQLERTILEAEDDEERRMRQAMELVASADASLDAVDFAETPAMAATRTDKPAGDTSTWWPVWHTAWRIAQHLGGPVAAAAAVAWDTGQAPERVANTSDSNLDEGAANTSLNDEADQNSAALPLVYPPVPDPNSSGTKNGSGGLDWRRTTRAYHSEKRSGDTAAALVMVYGPPVETPVDLILDPEAGTEDAAFFIHCYWRMAHSGAPTALQRGRVSDVQQIASHLRNDDAFVDSLTAGLGAAAATTTTTTTTTTRVPVAEARNAVDRIRAPEATATAKSGARADSSTMRTLPLGPTRQVYVNLQAWLRHRVQWSFQEDAALLQAWQRYGPNPRLLGDILHAQASVRLGLLHRRTVREIEERLQLLLAKKITEPSALAQWHEAVSQTRATSMRKHHRRSIQLAQRRVLGMRARLDTKRVLRTSRGDAGNNAFLDPDRAREASPRAVTADRAAAKRDALPKRTQTNEGARTPADAVPGAVAPAPAQVMDPRVLVPPPGTSGCGTAEATAAGSLVHRPGVKLEEELRRRRPFRRYIARLGPLLGFELRTSNRGLDND